MTTSLAFNMNDLTPALKEQLIAIIGTHKPYIIELEKEAQRIEHGTIFVEIGVRAKIITKMDIIEIRKKWLHEKQIDPK